MVTVENKLSNLPATQSYVDFGLEQVEAINAKYDQWFAQHTFSEPDGFSRFEKLVIDGHSDHRGHSSHGSLEPYDDRVQWRVDFGGKVENKKLDEALLGVTIRQKDRLPNVETFNSAPHISTSANYFHLAVTNGEQGWVKEGTFPDNVHMAQEFIDPDHPMHPSDYFVDPNFKWII